MIDVVKGIRTLERNILLIQTIQRSEIVSTDPFDDINQQILVELLVENEQLKDELAKNKEYANLKETTLNFAQIKAIENEMWGTPEKVEKYNWFRKE